MSLLNSIQLTMRSGDFHCFRQTGFTISYGGSLYIFLLEPSKYWLKISELRQEYANIFPEFELKKVT